MKKLLFIIALTISSMSFGQITLEHSYVTQGYNNYEKTYAFHTESGLNYYTLNTNENKVLLYNSSHNLFKTVILNLGAGFKLRNIFLATDKLFNTNSSIEFIARSSSDTETKMTLVDEDGINLFEFGDRDDANFIKNSDTNYKLIVTTDKLTPNFYEIYNLPGTLSILQQQALSKSQFFGYPNPTTNKITILNSLQNGENGKLEIFDINGKRVLERNVSGYDREIYLDVSNFENGVYIYKLNGETNRFIKK